ncbi:MAG TPA: 50S ribosomal protein L22 [Candidatus Omnitrophota bacterium]|nr:50S ribosomal protein L22 [Candidatus Omnitrophota bacterium]
MIAQAKARYMRVSPTKIRQVIDLIRGKDVSTSMAILTHVDKGSTGMITKVLGSAIQNAKQKGLSEDQLFVSKVRADQGPSWRRYRSAAFGRATGILKRTTHLTIELDLKTKS